jgi:GR25 family glycosyltransferase involved in LPS biosynthesis
MDKIDKIYYINLEKRIDRKEHFVNQCKQHKLPFSKIQRFPAVNGITYEINQDIMEMFTNSDFIQDLHFYKRRGMNETMYSVQENITKKIMGNQLSHYYILKDIIENNYEYAIICQDDAKFKNGIVEYLDNMMQCIPEDAEIINIGLNKYADMDFVIPWDFDKNSENEITSNFVNEYICKLDKNINPCSLAYIVTLRGATNLVQHFLTKGFVKATDYNFNEYLLGKDIFYSSREILVTTEDFGSDIFNSSNANL